MSKLHVTQKRPRLPVLSALILIMVTLLPAITPAQATDGSQTKGLSSDSSLVLPTWWSPERSAAVPRGITPSGSAIAAPRSTNVDAGSIDHIRINSAPDNGGQSSGGPVEVGDHVMSIYMTYTVWAAAYDQFDDYLGDLTITWGLSGVLGTGEIVPSPAISAVLTPAPVLSGTGAITATYFPSGLVDSTGVFTVQAPWLVIEKTRTWPPSEPVPAGTENMEYTVTFTNVGSADARDVRVTETYDSNVSFSFADPAPDQGDNVWVRSHVGKDDAPQSVMVLADVTGSVPPGTVLTNVVEIGGSRLQTAAFMVTTVVTATPQLIVSLTELDDPVDAGDALFLQVTWVNNGSALVSNIVLTLTLDPGVTFRRATVEPVITPTAGTGNVGRWEFAGLGGDSQKDFWLRVDVDEIIADQQALLNKVQIESDQTGPAFDFEITTVNAPALALTKSAAPSPVQANSLLTFTMIYTNEGHADGKNVVLTDTIPDDTDFVDGSCTPACLRIGDVVQWDLGTLGKGGGTGTASFIVDVHNGLEDGTLLANTAGAKEDLGHTAAAALTTVVKSAPMLTLTQVANSEPVRVTDELVYTLTYANVGNGSAYDVALTDVLPGDVTYWSGCELADNCARDGQRVIWNIGTITASAEGKFVLRVRVDPPLPDHTLLINSAVVSAATGTRALSRLTTTVVAPQLELTAIDDPDPVQPNALLTCTFVYTNSGDGYAASVILTAAQPDHTTFYACAPAPCGLVTGDVISWDLGRVSEIANGQATLVVSVANGLVNGTILSSDARLFAPDEAVSASLELTTSVTNQPFLWIQMDDGRTSVEAGDRLTYTLRYTNDGTSTAYGVSISVNLPDLSLAHYASCQPQAQCARADDRVTYRLGEVEGSGGGAVYLTIEIADPLPAGANHYQITTTAVISTTTPDDPVGDNDVQDIDDIDTQPDLQIHVDYHSHTPYPGKRLTYTIQFSNTGHIATTGVVVTATLPAHATYDPIVSSNWQSTSGASFTYPVGALDHNQHGALLLVVTLPAGSFTATTSDFDAAFGIIDDGGSGDDRDPGNNDAPAPLGVPDVIVESVDVNWASLLSGQVGQHVTVTLRNQGTNIACNPVPPPGESENWCAPFFVDLYINPEPIPPSYPIGPPFSDFYSDRAGPIHPGESQSVPISPFALPASIQSPLFLYVRVDNFWPEWPTGLVPERNELNNVFGPVTMARNLYLPIVLRSY